MTAATLVCFALTSIESSRMFDLIRSLLVQHHDALESAAAIATVFALIVPLPIFVASSVLQRRAIARDRAYTLIEKLDSEEFLVLRNALLRLIAQEKLMPKTEYADLSPDDQNELRRFLNFNEWIGLHVNTSRIERDTFYRFYRSSFIKDWDVLKPTIDHLRAKAKNPNIYSEWERAVQNARKR
ncbi:hypothetical protein ATY78_18345 [Rhizobium sp. R635]|uniref:DUF4760 domain-containing protein n=1 Tax=Rhizobium sp. R635 TaxID=1764275 RepID=UPI000B532611|nr:DUF4760 domain-containing protein [Rhizobium sp. R635]OWV89851.1 hypothetical protein ATY78_18345 [Rhizobium sp. R635]